MRKTIKKCPKTFNKYKAWVKEVMENMYPGENKKFADFLNSDLLIASIESGPISMIYFFDSLGLVGSLDYRYLADEFYIYVNGELISFHEDHQYSKDRKEAEKILIEYLFIEAEKTL